MRRRRRRRGRRPQVLRPRPRSRCEARKEAARAARTHGRVYVTGCGAKPRRGAFAGDAENVRSWSRGEGGRRRLRRGRRWADRGCVCRRDARLDRVSALSRCRTGDRSRARFWSSPLVRGASAQVVRPRLLGADPPAASPRATARVLNGINLGLYRTVRGYRLRGSCREAWHHARPRAASPLLVEINTVDAELVRALRDTPTRAATREVPTSLADDGSHAKQWDALLRQPPTCAATRAAARGLQPHDDVISRLSLARRGRLREHARRRSYGGRADEGARRPLLARRQQAPPAEDQV